MRENKKERPIQFFEVYSLQKIEPFTKPRLQNIGHLPDKSFSLWCHGKGEHSVVLVGLTGANESATGKPGDAFADGCPRDSHIPRQHT